MAHYIQQQACAASLYEGNSNPMECGFDSTGEFRDFDYMKEVLTATIITY